MEGGQLTAVEVHQQIQLSVIVPCYNEEAVVAETCRRLANVADSLGDIKTEFVFIDDGSTDCTWKLLSSFSAKDPRFRCVRLSRNFGHQHALTAGLDYVSGDAVAIIDADLQDPPECIPAMLDLWRNGADVVYGVRKNRKENIFLRSSYALFYRLLNRFSDTPIPLDSGDFCLLDRRVVNLLRDFPERNRFHRGMRAWVGFRQVEFSYDRDARAAGEAKYTFSKLLNLAVDGLVNFSSAPLRMIVYIGSFLSLTSLASIVFLLVWRVAEFRILNLSPADVSGFTTIVILVVFFSGFQLVCLGVIGTYIARLYVEIKNRPHYIVDATLPLSDQQNDEIKRQTEPTTNPDRRRPSV